MKGTIFDIQRYAIYDGPGIRTAVYLKGCPLRCRWCHNPESQKPEPEISRDPEKGMETTIGRKAGIEKIVTEILADKVFYDESGGGATITGGEPMFQPEFTLELLAALKEKNIHTAVETCGFFSSELLDELIKHCGLFLYDLKQIDPEKHRAGTGADNRVILENFKLLLARVGSERIIPRVPLIPGFNADEASIGAIADFVKRAGHNGPVHALPFHRWARDKYRRLGREKEFPRDCDLGEDSIGKLLARFTAAGLDHQLYG